MQIQIAQQQTERVGVFGFLHRFMAGTEGPDDAQPVGLRMVGFALGIGKQSPMKEAGGADRCQLGDDLPVSVDQLHATGPRLERTHHPARSFVGWYAMGPQHRKRIAQAAVHECVDRG